MSEKLRLDVYLVEKGLAQSRTHAQELIEAGQVFLSEGSQRRILKKASQSVTTESAIIVEAGPANRFVSRGGLKLEGALEHVKVSAKNLNVLDVGISTGGFTDCLLQAGAQFVLGVDVGHGQVHSSLLKNPKLKVCEGVNARNLSKEDTVLQYVPKDKFDLIVMDVSFISISLILPELSYFLKSNGSILSLVKPQFEVGVEGLGKGGIVKDESLYAQVEKKIREVCAQSSLEVLDYFPSPIEGKDGNREFFIYCRHLNRI
ncbi:hemolysin [Bdellovibrio bacteriovorus]|uniref:Hemolysin n=1 Tax=Bdellovibrio bacteriovorus TaxID=959 RepID=A0A150WCS9_BDEBC|nr:TlyA family RNA methyltransferase [Bdellovibrio bacteriovorus]KYG60678.1 hemolysin [Bdellovibrio bacteriovorus]